MGETMGEMGGMVAKMGQGDEIDSLPILRTILLNIFMIRNFLNFR